MRSETPKNSYGTNTVEMKPSPLQLRLFDAMFPLMHQQQVYPIATWELYLLSGSNV